MATLTIRSRPQARTTSWSVSSEGACSPDSQRAIVDAGMPRRAASARWERPARRREIADKVRSQLHGQMIADTICLRYGRKSASDCPGRGVRGPAIQPELRDGRRAADTDEPARSPITASAHVRAADRYWCRFAAQEDGRHTNGWRGRCRATVGQAFSAELERPSQQTGPRPPPPTAAHAAPPASVWGRPAARRFPPEWLSRRASARVRVSGGVVGPSWPAVSGACLPPGSRACAQGR